MMKRILIAAILAGAASAAPAQPTPAGPPAEKVRQVIVYGNDPCPTSSGTEILVCARQEERERYRIPKELRDQQPPGSTKNESWTNRVRSVEYVGRSGTESCSPVGGGGFTGCFEKIAAAAKAERAQMGDKSWADLVAAERAKRMSHVDEESKEIEARAQAEEKAQAEAQARANAADAAATATPGGEQK